MRLIKWIQALFTVIIFSLVVATLCNAQFQSPIVIEKKVLEGPIPPIKTRTPDGLTDFLIENDTREFVSVSIFFGDFTYYSGAMGQACPVEKRL